jgi:hypothetical protein
MASKECGIKVAIRVRPFNKRESAMNSKLIVDMVDKSVIVTNPVSMLHRITKERKKHSATITAIGHIMASLETKLLK